MADEPRTPRGPRGADPARLGAPPAGADADHAVDRRRRRPARVLHRRRDRRLAPDPHVRPAAVRGLGAALEPGGRGPQALRAERLLRLPLRLLAPAGRAPRALLPLPEGLRSRATSGAATSRRTCSAPSAPGPDLSQEAGWHPDDWQRAHFYDPRFVDPLSLMPSMKSLFSDKQVEQLISFVADAQRQVGAAPLRGSALREARRARRTRASSRRRPASRARTGRSPRAPT